MVKEVARVFDTSCKMFDTSYIVVEKAATIPATGNPLLVNISVNNHGELSSRETCRNLRPSKENILNQSSNVMTRISSSETSNKMNLHQNNNLPGMTYTSQLNMLTNNVNLQTQQFREKISESQSHSLPPMTSFHLSDELNTPDIGLNSEFNFDPHCIGSSAAAASDLSMDHYPVLGEDFTPIPFNNNTANSSIVDIFDWSTPIVNNNPSPMVKSPIKRPVELKLTFQTSHATSLGFTPNIDTPIMNMDTPDVLQHFEDTGAHFNILTFVNGDKKTLDSPQLFPRNSNKAATIKREQRFVEEDIPQNQFATPTYCGINEENMAVEDEGQEIEFLNNIKPEVEEEIPYLNPVSKIQESFLPEVKQETFTPPPSVPSPVNEVVVKSLKRSSRLMSRESTSRIQYEGDDVSDTDSDYTSTSQQSSNKRQRYSSSTCGGKVVKSEVDEDASSIASSALEMKYSELRHRNNEASRKSRQNRKTKENVMEAQAEQLGAENRRLKAHVSKLEHLVQVLRKALLDSVTRANKK